MPTNFVHSVKVPRLYKSAAKVIRKCRQHGDSLKKLIYEEKHPNVSVLYAVCINTLQKEAQLNYLLSKTGILKNEPRLDPWLAKVLITELLWRKKPLKSDCKPVQTILSYEKQLQHEWINIDKIDAPLPSISKAKIPRYVRVNTILLPLNKALSFFNDEGWSLLPKCENYIEHLSNVNTLSDPHFMQDFHVPEVLVFPPSTNFNNHSGYKSGQLVLQDKASCIPTHLLNPEPGSVVLDMCAAPGMKTSHLAAIMNNTGKIYAVELHKGRYLSLCKQISVTGASCVNTINADAMSLNKEDYIDVEYILVDPSCSGTGMINRQLISEGEEECSPERLKQLQAFQVFLLRHALLNFPKVKRVVYSTCSIKPEENEQVIDEILGNIQDAYKLVSIKKTYKKNWLNYSSKDYKCSNHCLYAKTEQDLCNGFFVAVFERNFNVLLPYYKLKTKDAFAENQAQLEIQHRLKKRRGKRSKMDENTVMQASTTDNTVNDSSAQEHRTVEKDNTMEEITVNDSAVSNDSVSITEEETLQENDDEDPPKKKKKSRKIKEEDNEEILTQEMKKKRKKLSMIRDKAFKRTIKLPKKKAV